MTQHTDKPQRGKKQYARRDDVNSGLLDVTNDVDFAVMRALQTGRLMCPLENCSTRFTRPPLKTNGTRFLRNKTGSDCQHGSIPKGGGGKMTAEHSWIRDKLCALLREAGYPVQTEEHVFTHADVMVRDPMWALEIQRGKTNFAARTKARQEVGANVIWLLPSSATSEVASKALFSLPAARIRVLDRRRRQDLQPWLHPETEAIAQLFIGATVLTLRKGSDQFSSDGNYDAVGFFAEVLSGKRIWMPKQASLPWAGWVLKSEWERQNQSRTDTPRHGTSTGSFE